MWDYWISATDPCRTNRWFFSREGVVCLFLQIQKKCFPPVRRILTTIFCKTSNYGDHRAEHKKIFFVAVKEINFNCRTKKFLEKNSLRVWAQPFMIDYSDAGGVRGNTVLWAHEWIKFMKPVFLTRRLRKIGRNDATLVFKLGTC
jgi:hypothetical protein